ncbi:hypothetical protein QYE76_064574 [Lolium multiflorum]|uniref:RNase H type-1 domain-containing protein n=1 Tax=Lolium multiflorum TaxID=4521 RepID=A0AAD8S738_LOLMU|nr:hypothetical protein QYE76_064574 [Lolium multiflorum]
MPCLAHLDPATGKSTHTNRNCKWVNDLKNDPEAGYKRARKHRPRGKGGKGKNKDKEEDSSEAMDDEASPEPKEGTAANKSNPFGKKSVGTYHTFLGTPTVREKSELRILNATVPWCPSSSYHVIFGRPTYHKFHARACYIYNKLKIPGPNGATYQRTMQRCLKDQIGRNVHAYVDDIAVMTRKGSDLLSDLKETFDNLRRDTLTFEASIRSFPRQPEAETLLPGAPNVVSKAPLATIINNSDATGRVAKWGIELSAFDINYEARTAIKSQVLADFIADWTEAPEGTPVPEPEAWVMHFDGSKQHQGSGAGVTLKSPTGEELQYVLQIHFEATNNMAEYEALLHGLRIAKEIGIKHIICCGDSDLVAQQVAGTWNARNSVMAAYRDEVDEIAKCFLGYEVKYVRRDDNTAADMLSKLGSGRKPIPPGVFLEHLRVPSVKGANPENPDLAVSPAKEVMAIIPAWTQPFLDYLIDQKLPEDEVHARQIIRRARFYTIVDGQLYKRSANGVFLKCVSSQDGIEILREIHAGDCGHHAAPDPSLQKLFG